MTTVELKTPNLEYFYASTDLASMTRKISASPGLRNVSSTWPLQDAKARFSELVRRARSEGPQHVTVHGREEVVVMAVNEFRRLKGEPTGQALIDALRNSPYPEIDLEPERFPMPVPEVDL